MDEHREAAQAKSITKLLWALWGLGWIITPVLLTSFRMQRHTPAVMFLSLAAILIVTWHKGALIRAGIRWFKSSAAQPSASSAPASPARRRVEVDGDQRVRVHATDLRPEELVGDTEVRTNEHGRTRHARYR